MAIHWHHCHMKWIIQCICARESSVYLVKPECGALRQISVPGVEDAWIKGEKLIIKATIGYFWEVEPESESRKRIFGRQPLL
jgi:hypothetical protein